MNNNNSNRRTIALEQILTSQEIVVQRVSSELDGKYHKYRAIDIRRQVPYHFDDVTMDKIKTACVNYFSVIDERVKDMTCDVLATERGPSCGRIEEIPNLRLIVVRFVW